MLGPGQFLGCVWKVSRGVWIVSGGVLKVSGRCLGGVRKVFGVI